MRVVAVISLLLVLANGSKAFSTVSCGKADAEPALSVTLSTGGGLALCGFEDRDLTSSGGKRAFSEFEIWASEKKGEAAKKIFSSAGLDTHWVKEVPGKGLEIEELWELSEQPQPALLRTVACEAECTVSDPKCVLKIAANPYPKALSQLQRHLKKPDPNNDVEALIDEVLAQALSGDKAARKFFSKRPKVLDGAAAEAFDSDAAKLKAAVTLGCVKK